MPEDRTLISLADLVREAAEIVDPQGTDAAVEEFALRHEDADAPVRTMLDGLEERLLWGADEDAPIVMAQALTLYLAHRLDEVHGNHDELLKLAARAEFDGHPPDNVVEWLRERGVHL